MPRNSHTDALATQLCQQVAQGQALSAAVRACGLTPSTVHGWYHRYAGFRNQLDAARERAAGLIGQQALRIADDASGDLIEQPDGRITANTTRVKRDQLRASMRLKLAERYNPQSYGTGKRSAGPVQINITLSGADAAALERYREIAASIPGEPVDD